MGRPIPRSLAPLAALCATCAPLVVFAHLPARVCAAPSVQQHEHIEPASNPAPGWLQRALRHGAGDLPPAPPTDDPHASALTVELVVADARPGAPRADLSAIVVEVSIVAPDPSAPSWTAVARVGPGGSATFARVPEGRPNVLVLVPDAARVPLVPDPARYGLSFEPFSGGPFPHLALDEVPAESGARVVQLHLVPGLAANGRVELDASPPAAHATRPGELSHGGALVWVASPGWLQLAPLDVGGGFGWFEPRAMPAAPFDPAAPSAGFLERLTGGVTRPPGATEGAWRECVGVPAPPFGHTFVIELTTEQSVGRAGRTEDPGPAPLPGSEPRAEASHAASADALVRWRALRATPITTQLEGEAVAPAELTRAEKAALARALVERHAPREGVQRFIAEVCRWELDPAHSAAPEWRTWHVEQHELLCLAREWLALGPQPAEEAELALLDRAASPVSALTRELYHVGFSTEVPLQLWIDVVAPRHPRYAETLAAFGQALRAPRRTASRGSLPAGLAELDAEALDAALRRRPSSTLGAELAPFVRSAPRDAAERMLTCFAALARDDARGSTVRTGAVDLLLALGARPSGDGPALAELVLAALADEPSDVALSQAVLAALAPLAPARALAAARSELTTFAASDQHADTSTWQVPPMGALLALGHLAPGELAQRAEATPSLALYAAAALLLDGIDALDTRGLPHAFLERLLR